MEPPIYTFDWFAMHEHDWNKLFKDVMGKPDVTILELGSYEGRTARWLLENVLTHETSKLYCVDTFAPEKDVLIYEPNSRVLENFIHNMKPFAEKVVAIQEFTSIALKNPLLTSLRYDFIYIDACHRARNVLEDAVLSFPLLKIGGLLIFDDYGQTTTTGDVTIDYAKAGVDCFLTCYADCYRLLFKNYQVGIVKTRSTFD